MKDLEKSDKQDQQLYFDGTPTKIKRPAPKLGEHSKEILDHLGISEETQNRMIEEGKVILSG